MTHRNDPCPCRSGKKFKKCCLGKKPAAVPSAIFSSVLNRLRYSPWISVIITVVLGLIIYRPMHNVVFLMATGDHGKEFYAYWQSSLGKLVYRDFYWPFGPLMPFVYGWITKVSGFSVANVLIICTAVNLISGLGVFMLLLKRFGSGLSLLGALWFYIFNHSFYHTFNHQAGILAIIFIIYFLHEYIDRRQVRWLCGATAGLFLLFLNKFNMGLAVWAGVGFFLLMDCWADRRQTSFLRSFIRITLLMTSSLGGAILVYTVILWKLPWEYVLQCFPYLPGYGQTMTDKGMTGFEVFNHFIGYLKTYFDGNVLRLGPMPPAPKLVGLWGAKALAVLVLLAVCVGISNFQTVRKNLNSSTRRSFFLLMVIGVMTSHEFILSGFTYRLFWSEPVWMVLIFYSIGILMSDTLLILRSAAGIFAAICLFIGFQETDALAKMIKSRPEAKLSMPSLNVYVNNQSEWMNTVQSTALYLKKRLKKDESVLAVPYDPLYYVLLEKSSPTREIAFFKFKNAGTEQQKEMIRHIKNANVQYVVMSNRALFPETKRLGKFGQDHSQTLKKYIDENYVLDQTYGKWNQKSGWAWSHSTQILRKKSS